MSGVHLVGDTVGSEYISLFPVLILIRVPVKNIYYI